VSSQVPEPSAPGDRLNRLIRDLSTETILLHQAIADRLGLNPTDHKALGFLLDAGRPITAGRLALEMGLTTGAITGIVDRLEEAGFMRRKRDPADRRQVMLEVIMDKVRREVFPVFEQLGKQMSALAGSYSRRDLATITDFVERGVAISREYRAKLQPRGKG
jgi:DNA-binding MarR family transcriptional regulator